MKVQYSKVQIIISIAILLVSFFPDLAPPARAASTTSVLGGGITINEVLVDPNDGDNFDTDGNGTADSTDEFVEIYNLSGTSIDISGFELWDSSKDNWFTFPSGTTLGAGNYAVVVCGVQTGGSLPSVSGGNLAFDAGSGSAIINNGGDNVVLYDPDADEYIQLRYNGDAADDPPEDYAGDGFSSTATRVGPVEDWGDDSDGISLVRDPAGDTNVDLHDDISSNNASPGEGSNPASDTAPSVSSTIPAENDICVDVTAEIEIGFSEGVNVASGWFTITCTSSGGHAATVSGGPQNYTLDPDVDFDGGETCTVTIDKDKVSDTDSDDPPNNMIDDYDFSFETSGGAGVCNLIINEVDADTPSTDNAEFVELYDGGDGNTDLTGLVLVFFNGNGDVSYEAFDLDGRSTDSDGYFVLCGDAANVSNCDWDVSPDTDLIQNGADAVALYVGDEADFPDGTSVTTNDLLDAIVYDTGDSDDSGLLVLLHTGQPQVDEDAEGDSPNHSNQRCPNGTGDQRDTDTYAQYHPTPGEDNTCGAIPELGSCGDPATFIHEVQGDSALSPMEGTTGVVIEGVVVGDFQDTSTELSGFFVQEEVSDADADPLTSEGVFVYDNGFGVDVSVGDVVRLQGEVDEYYTLTELKNLTAISECSSGLTVNPTPITLPESVNGDLERYEGMLVNVNTEMTVAQNYFLGRYGQLTLSANGRMYQPTNQFTPGSSEANDLADANARSLLILDDGMDVSSWGDNPNPVPYLGSPPPTVIRAGDTVTNLIGVLGYGQINTSYSGPHDYRLHPTASPIFTQVNTRTAVPEDVGGTITVASFNVLNYFTTLDSGSDICGPTGGLECRGADSVSEFTRQRDKIVEAMCAINADIFGLMEIENQNPDNDPAPGDGINNYVLQDLVGALNDVSSSCPDKTYTFTDDTATGTDAIRVGIIYKSDAVTPTGNMVVLDDPGFTDPNDLGGQKNRPAVAETFEDSKGERFTVVVNHLKSKGSSCGPGDDDTTTGQGNCNGTREGGAEYLINWLATDPTDSNDLDIIVIGDLNAYAKEDPIMVFTDNGYSDVIATYVGSTAYSYIFDGQSGYLDHALASHSMSAQVTSVTEWHINTDEPAVIDYDEDYNPAGYYNADAYRSSDHDPVVIGLDLASELYVTFLPLVLRD